MRGFHGLRPRAGVRQLEESGSWPAAVDAPKPMHDRPEKVVLRRHAWPASRAVCCTWACTAISPVAPGSIASMCSKAVTKRYWVDRLVDFERHDERASRHGASAPEEMAARLEDRAHREAAIRRWQGSARGRWCGPMASTWLTRCGGRLRLAREASVPESAVTLKGFSEWPRKRPEFGWRAHRDPSRRSRSPASTAPSSRAFSYHLRAASTSGCRPTTLSLASSSGS